MRYQHGPGAASFPLEVAYVTVTDSRELLQLCQKPGHALLPIYIAVIILLTERFGPSILLLHRAPGLSYTLQGRF